MYENEKLIIFATCLSLGVVISKQVEYYLTKKRIKISSFFTTLIVILSTSLFLNYIATGLTMKPIKFLLSIQKKNIEGSWLNAVKLENGDLIISYCNIEYKKREVVFSGANFNRDGTERSGRFYTNFTSLNHPHLNYKYTWTEHNNKANKIEGIGELQFFESNSFVKGEFQNLNTSTKNIIYGTKLTKSETILWNNESIEKRRKLIEQKIHNISFK